MKNKIKITAQLILVATLLFSACKKKDDNKTTEPAPATTPTPQVNPLTAMVSNVSFTTGVWYNNGFKDVYRILFSKNANVISLTAFKGNNASNGEGIELKFPYGTGTYTLAQQSTHAAYYGYYNTAKDTISYWSANTATISISQIDTVGAGADIVKTLKGTFTFSTSLNKNLTFNVTDGVIDYTKP